MGVFVSSTVKPGEGWFRWSACACALLPCFFYWIYFSLLLRDNSEHALHVVCIHTSSLPLWTAAFHWGHFSTYSLLNLVRIHWWVCSFSLWFDLFLHKEKIQVHSKQNKMRHYIESNRSAYWPDVSVAEATTVNAERRCCVLDCWRRWKIYFTARC